MKIEALGVEYLDITLNINNEEVIFKNYIADVTDDLGKFMIDEFPHFFPEGKVILPEDKTKVHVFDETKYLEQIDKIAKLNASLKVKNQNIEELKVEMKEWQKLYEDLYEQFTELTLTSKSFIPKETEIVPKKAIKEIKSITNKEEYQLELESKGLEALKQIAKEIKVPSSEIAKKNSKKEWIIAIVNKTFKS